MTVTVDQIARIAYEANRAYCRSIGDFSHVLWEDASQDIKKATIHGILRIQRDPDITPEQIHEEWRLFKEESGWKYGAVKDPVKKTHPCMLPYNKMHEKDKIKDIIFLSIAKPLLKL